MLLVIFGAGASFDSVPKRDWSTEQDISEHKLPLAAGLFQSREPFRRAVEEYWECAPLVGKLRHVVARRENIETYLEREVVESESDQTTLSQLVALRHYIDQIISECSRKWLGLCNGVTNYATLLDTIDRWRRRRDGERIILATFNYDVLLEDACIRTLRRRMESPDDYVSGSPYFVFKPHGSVSWRRRVRFERRADPSPHELIEFASLIRFTDDYFIQGQQGSEATLPAIAIPTQFKPAFECPTLHVETFEKLIPQVSRVLVIGWRGQEQHFLDKCAGIDSAAQGMVVSQDHAHAAETALHLADTLKIEVVAGDFSGFTGLATQDEKVLEWLES
jgi:hypothetical protein